MSRVSKGNYHTTWKKPKAFAELFWRRATVLSGGTTDGTMVDSQGEKGHPDMLLTDLCHQTKHLLGIFGGLARKFGPAGLQKSWRL